MKFSPAGVQPLALNYYTMQIILKNVDQNTTYLKWGHKKEQNKIGIAQFRHGGEDCVYGKANNMAIRQTN